VSALTRFASKYCRRKLFKSSLLAK
jgi:hypothetical protein